MSFRALILVFGLSTLSGCATAVVGAVGVVGVTALQDKSMGEGFDDASASNELKAKLMSAGPRRYNEVDVEFAGRVALLTGRVSEEIDKVEAERMAWTVRLIEDVANEIQVREPGGIKQNANDEWITARVRTKLLTDGAVKSMNINIETYDGIVYLMGLARSPAELERAAKLAARVRGVKEVVSYIEIREPKPLHDPGQTQIASDPENRYDPNNY